MKTPALIERLDRNRHRAGEIGAVLVKYGLADWLRKIPAERVQEWLQDDHGQPIPDLSPPQRVRFALTELGPTFIKLGQMLSTRPDVVGQELARELTQLQNRTPPDSHGTAQALVKKELHQPVEALFAHFEPEPFASASIAQVHHARLHSGEKVVVKVQKHGIEEVIEADLMLLADLSGLAEKYASELRRYRPAAIVRQFAKSIRGELDFTRERRNLENFRLHFAEDDSVHFPQPWPELSSRRVLTMERLDGILLSQTTKLRHQASDLNAFARRGATVFLNMVFRDGFFHADPHPSNLMWLESDVVGIVDCGMVHRLDEGMQETLVNVLLAVSGGDAGALAESVWRLSSVPPSGSKEQLRADLADFLDDYMGQAINEVQLGLALTNVTEIIRRHDIFLPPAISSLLRMLIELEGTAQLLNPSFSLLELIQPYYSKILTQQYAPSRIVARFERNAHAWGQLMHRLPHDLKEMVEQIHAGTLSVHLDHRRLDPVANRLVLGMVASALFLGSSLLWSTEAPPLVHGVSLFGVIGYALALGIGLKLFRAIRRSESEKP